MCITVICLEQKGPEDKLVYFLDIWFSLQNQVLKSEKTSGGFDFDFKIQYNNTNIWKQIQYLSLSLSKWDE